MSKLPNPNFKNSIIRPRNFSFDFSDFLIRFIINENKIFGKIVLLKLSNPIDSTRNIILEVNSHTALEVKNNQQETVHFGLSVLDLGEKQLIIFSPLFIFRSYLSESINITLDTKTKDQKKINIPGKCLETVVYNLGRGSDIMSTKKVLIVKPLGNRL